jgi:uncharacterized membrane protein YphA (DoxX/SURF4 family)
MPVKKISSPLLHLSRIIAGSVFIYSGFVKGIDPLGSAYKFADYFVAFNTEFLEPAALPLSLVLSSAEMLIGVLLLAGVHMAITSWAVFLFMSFFTVLTLYIAVNDPVEDCGCFGDAIILTNWETFWKNVVLMVFVLYLLLKRKKFSPFFNKSLAEWSTLLAFLMTIIGISAWSYLNLPVIDFRPFNIGADINEKMSVPPDAPADEYEITLYYEKDGEKKPFSVDNLPGPDWEWVSTESTLISKGYVPPITDFYIEAVDDGTDYTYSLLEDQGYTFMLIAFNLEKSSVKSTDRINRLAEWSAGQGVNFICLTASPLSQIDDFKARTGASYQFYHADEITLKTVIRSNPGLVLLKNGTILGKWHYRNIPHADELKGNLLSYCVEIQQKSKNDLVTLGHLLALFLILTMLRIMRKRLKEKIVV